MKRHSLRADLIDFGCRAVAELAVITLIACLLGYAWMKERGQA